jgi:hypothetical protein
MWHVFQRGPQGNTGLLQVSRQRGRCQWEVGANQRSGHTFLCGGDHLAQLLH